MALLYLRCLYCLNSDRICLQSPIQIRPLLRLGIVIIRRAAAWVLCGGPMRRQPSLAPLVAPPLCLPFLLLALLGHWSNGGLIRHTLYHGDENSCVVTQALLSNSHTGCARDRNTRCKLTGLARGGGDSGCKRERRRFVRAKRRLPS